MRKAKEKNKPLVSLAAAGLAALLLFGMATAVLAQGTQGKFVADEQSGISEADSLESDNTDEQAESQASTAPVPTRERPLFRPPTAAWNRREPRWQERMTMKR